LLLKQIAKGNDEAFKELIPLLRNNPEELNKILSHLKEED